MKKNHIFTMLLLMVTILSTSSQVGTNFDQPNGGVDLFVDSNLTAHTLVNNSTMGTVSHISSSGELGFTTRFTPTRNNTTLGVVGLSDGDYIGVYNQATIPSTSSDISSWSLGNSYVIEDTDGMITVEFDEVNLVGTNNPRFQMKMWIDDTSYEFSDNGNDRVLIKLEINNGASEIVIVDTDGGTGKDLNDYLYNGNSVFNVITDIDIDLSAQIGNTVKLIIEADFNSSAEQITFDNIYFTEGTKPVAWTGAINSDWSTPNNWSSNSIPITTDNVVIPNVANKPLINSTTGAVANNITIDTGASLTVNNGGSLIIDGTATVNGSFNYKVNVTDTKWHLIASPVNGEQYDDSWNTTNGINTSGTGNNEAVATYINNTDANGDWVYFQDGGVATTFGAGIGYSLNRASAGNYTFSGSFPEHPIKPTITANDIGGANENRWTLVGNPFPAYIDINAFLIANSTPLTDTHESIYVWNANAGVSGEYQPLTSGFIHPGQGFFVNSNVASTSVTFTKAMQSHQNGVTLYRNSNPKITLIANDGTHKKSTEINYMANKTIGLDPRFDIGTFSGRASNFNIYTRLVDNDNGVSFAIQALPNNNYDNMVIPVGIKASTGKKITFTVEKSNFPNDINVLLEDKKTNQFYSLSELDEKYSITLSEDLNDIGRFYLHTSSNALTTSSFNTKAIDIYTTSKTNLRITGLQNREASIKLFNIVGKKVYSNTFTPKLINDINLPRLKTGVYLVQITTEAENINKKIIIE